MTAGTDRLSRRNSARLRQTSRWLLLRLLPRTLITETSDAVIPGLSFDDGPHPDYTPEILDILAARRMRAAFFVIGERAARHPDLVRRIVAEGHLLGNHSYTHPAPRSLAGREYAADAERARDELQKISGVRPSAFRPPHGFLTASTAVRVWQNGHQVVLWNVDPKDFELDSPDALIERLKALAPAPGDLILLHDTSATTARALPTIIDEILPRSRGEVADG